MPRRPAKLNRTERRILEARQEIAERPQPLDQELTFCGRELVLATLPHQEPRGNPHEWVRKNGYFTLSVRPGSVTDPTTGRRVSLGYPFGVLPRLVLLWMTAEVVRNRSPRLRLADSFNDFMRKVGARPDTGGGKRSDRKRLRDQLERLFRATISFDYRTEDRAAWLDMPVAPSGELWWDTRGVDQAPLSESWIELGEQFFETLLANPVPLDTRAITALRSSSLALDLYAWISYRYFGVCQRGRSAFIPWRGLMQQLGSGYGDLKNFKRNCKRSLNRLATLYPHLAYEQVEGGIKLSPGRPLISP